MKIKPLDAYPTPKDWDELTQWIQRHDKGRWSHLLTAAAMAWNLACALSTKEH